MRRIGLVCSTLAALLIAGCASRGEIETMKRQLDYLERSSIQMQDRMAQLDSMYRLTIEKNVSYQADLKTALAELIDKSSAIDGRLSDMERRINSIANRFDQGGSASVPTSGGSTAPVEPKADSAAAEVLPQVDQERLFNSAFTDLKSGSYDLAIMQFNEFLNLFKDSPLADDAQYWLGECYYGKKDYVRAIPEFEKVDRNYPKGDKLVPALYKLGRSHEESGDRKKARVIFQRITTEFPTSFEAKPAQERLKGL